MTEPDAQTDVSRESVPRPNAVPPQQPGEIGRPAQRSNWPTVIGVISIVFGSGACLGGVWGFLAPHFIKMMADWQPPNQAALMPDMSEWASWIFVTSVLTIVIALILLVAGIDLLRRRMRAIKLARVWAVLRMIFALVGAYMGFLIQQAQFRQMSPQSSPVGGSFFVAVSVFGMLVGILWGWAFPIFLLVWFSRAKIKAEYLRWP